VSFTSLEFCLYFVVVSVVYFQLPPRGRQWLLLVASAWFYGRFVPAFLLILVGVISVDYIAGRCIERAPMGSLARRSWLWASLVANIGLLMAFKYGDFLLANFDALVGFVGIGEPGWRLGWILPIGLSFHTFQALSYVFEVYAGRVPAERDLLRYALYVLFFPQLVAGPIERPQHLLPRLACEARFSAARMRDGLSLMAWGFFKKLVIADRLAPLADAAYRVPGETQAALLVVGTVAFAFQIFADFSGYSDIARGAGRVLGVELMENFAAPYGATSVREFWTRWHRSLSTWFRDYVYIPLGGNREGGIRRARNTLITFALSGLWHGANWTFMVWGLLNGVLVVGRDVLPRKSSIRCSRFAMALATVGTFLLICLTWVFFRAATVGDAVTVIDRMFRGWSEHGLRGQLVAVTSAISPVELLLALIAVPVMLWREQVPLPTRGLNGDRVRLRGHGWAMDFTVVLATLLFGRHFAQRTFIYFQF
jgi:alginate O-acetyltransferase complex protein AlgI